MKAVEEQRWLRAVGFPIAVDGNVGSRTRQARRDFRRAQGPRVRARWKSYQKRLEWSAKNGGRFNRKSHFRYVDWKSNGNGWIKVDRELLRWCEEVRRKVGAFGILSGYRDPVYNHRIGGASNSQHLYGTALDPSRRLPLAPIRALANRKRKGGIGICSGSNTTCCHFDTGPRREWHY